MPDRPTEADVMRGGPGSAADGTAPAPNHGDPAPYDGRDPNRRSAAPAPAATTRKLVLDGVEYEVDPALATALRKEQDRVAGTYGARLQQYERRLAALEAGVDEPEPEDTRQAGLQPPDPKWLDATSDSYDPQRYHQANLEYNHALVSAGIEAVESRRHEEAQIAASRASQQENWNRHVSKFYQDHPSLRGNEDLVDAVWRGNFASLKDLDLEAGFRRLGELANARLVQLTENGKRQAAPRAPRLETSASARANRAPEPTEEPESTPIQGGLSAAIKAKRHRFLNPDFKGKAA